MPPSAPYEVSIIVATRNSAADLERCLPSISQGGSTSCELIVVDNASTDRSLSIVKECDLDVKVIANSSNLGHCRAVNQGLRAATADLVLLLDADTVIWPGAIDCLLARLRARPEVVMAAPRMLNTDGSIQETARAFPRPVNALFGRQTLLTKWFQGNPISARYLKRRHAEDDEPFEVDWVSAACMLFRRSLIDGIGLWDERFAGYWVDADWCWRAHSVGRIICEPAARVTHVEQNRAGRKRDAARIVQFHAGVNRFYRKHYTRGWLDPRALSACALLAGRATLLLVANALRRSNSAAALSSRAKAAQAVETRS